MHLLDLLDGEGNVGNADDDVGLQVGFVFTQVQLIQWRVTLVPSLHVILKLKSWFPRRDIEAMLGMSGQLMTVMKINNNVTILRTSSTVSPLKKSIFSVRQPTPISQCLTQFIHLEIKPR